MIMLKCEACGGNDLKRLGNMYECSYCGSKYMLDEHDELVGKEPKEVIFVIHS